MTEKRTKPLQTAENPIPDVRGRWLLGAFLGTLAAAAACVYVAICAMFYFGQWQFAFQPPKPLVHAATPSTASMAVEDVRFDYTEAGTAQLDGWWIPAAGGAVHADAVVLVCHGGATSLPEELALLKNLHALGINVFAFDYRGFGGSVAMHPSEQSTYADGVAALRYLTDTRHISANKVAVYGNGMGAAVAVHVAQQAPRASAPVAGVILENAKPSLFPDLMSDPRVNYLPVRLLFHDRFDIQSALASLTTPKLFLFDDEGLEKQAIGLYGQSAKPKQLVGLPGESDRDWSNSVARFLQNVL